MLLQKMFYRITSKCKSICNIQRRPQTTIKRVPSAVYISQTISGSNARSVRQCAMFRFYPGASFSLRVAVARAPHTLQRRCCLRPSARVPVSRTARASVHFVVAYGRTSAVHVSRIRSYPPSASVVYVYVGVRARASVRPRERYVGRVRVRRWLCVRVGRQWSSPCLPCCLCLRVRARAHTLLVVFEKWRRHRCRATTSPEKPRHTITSIRRESWVSIVPQSIICQWDLFLPLSVSSGFFRLPPLIFAPPRNSIPPACMCVCRCFN